MGWLAAVGQFFGAERVTDTAMRVVEKLTGTDFSAREKADFILQYQAATKHQSPARRLIATVIAGYWILLGVTWLVCTVVGNILEIERVLDIAITVNAHMSSNVAEPMNYVIMFYFGSAIIAGIKK